MFESVTPAPADPILGLTEAFKADPRPSKVNLGVGIYQDEEGRTPVLPSVKAAETAVVGAETTKAYLPIAGDPDYGRLVEDLLFEGADASARARMRTAYAPGGTGALRVGADFLAEATGRASRAWISSPSWPNHRGLFAAAGLAVADYPYYDPVARGVAADRMLEGLAAAKAGDVVVLHLGCHNPTGADLAPDQWRALAALAAKGGWVPFVDAAYLGFGDGLAPDAAPLRILLDAGVEFLVAASFSKNMGLYRERAGALTAVARDAKAAEAVFSRIKRSIRVLFSNAVGHTALTVTRVLSDRMLRTTWLAELDAMRGRILRARGDFAAGLAQRVPGSDFSFITRQRGMFSFSGLTPAQVEFLRAEKAVYMTGDGRINVAGVTPRNMDAVCDAIAAAIAAVR